MAFRSEIPDANETRDALAEVLCKGTADRECINYDYEVAGGCSWCQRDADAIMRSPVIAQIRADALREAADDIEKWAALHARQSFATGFLRQRADDIHKPSPAMSTPTGGG